MDVGRHCPGDTIENGRHEDLSCARGSEGSEPMVSRPTTTVTPAVSRSSVRREGIDSLHLPKDVTLEFARALLEFMNAAGGRSSYRLVIEEDDMLLERVRVV